MEKKNWEIVKFNKTVKIDGFAVKRGFVGAVQDGHLLAVSSGWCSGGRFILRNCECDGGGYFPDYNNVAAVYERNGGKWEVKWVEVDNDTPTTAAEAVAEEVLRRDARELSEMAARWNAEEEENEKLRAV